MKRKIIIGLLLSVFVGCEEWQEYPKEFPIVTPMEVQNINVNGAEFFGNVESVGENQNILRYGFVYNQKGEPTLDNSLSSISGDIGAGMFSKVVNNDLQNGRKYSVRAFIETDRLVVYGNPVTFVSKGSKRPVIRDFSPREGTVGTEVTIEGANFSTQLFGGNIITIGEATCDVIYATESQLKIKVPALRATGRYQVVLVVAGYSVDAPFRFSYIR